MCDDAERLATIPLPRVRAMIAEAVAAEREACAKLVEAGGDGKDRLETAIQYGPNAAIAEAIRARGGPTP